MQKEKLICPYCAGDITAMMDKKIEDWKKLLDDYDKAKENKLSREGK